MIPWAEQWRGNYPRPNAYRMPNAPSNAQQYKNDHGAFWARGETQNLRGELRNEVHAAYARYESCDSDAYVDECNAMLSTDQEYVVPVFLNGLETWGWRDSGCDVPLLISKDLIKAEDIDYENCLTLKGAFDKKQHTLHSNSYCESEVATVFVLQKR